MHALCSMLLNVASVKQLLHVYNVIQACAVCSCSAASVWGHVPQPCSICCEQFELFVEDGSMMNLHLSCVYSSLDVTLVFIMPRATP